MKNFEHVEGAVTGDKYVHFTFYFVFTLLWYFFFRIHTAMSNFKIRLVVFLFAFFFGLLIEACQEFFTADRSADVLDVVANTSGSIAAVVVLWIVRVIKNKNTV
jgi:VanZ family protein